MEKGAAAFASYATRPWDALTDSALKVRDRLITSARFQCWAAKFPLTRSIARRYERDAFNLCAGFVYSQTLLAAIRLGALEQLLGGSLPKTELIARLPLPESRACLLVNAMIALGLISERSRGRVGLAMLGGAIVANPSIAALVEHNALLYEDIKDPLALLKTETPVTRISQFWPYLAARSDAGIAPENATAYSSLMTRSQAMISEQILDAYSFNKHRRILDVGGGEGAFLTAMAGRAPDAVLELFDLSPVAERASIKIAAVGLSSRIGVTAGSFLTDPLPCKQDAVTLIRIVHDHDDAAVRSLFRKVREALVPGGAIIIAEPMSGDPHSARVADVYFAFYLLAMGSGRPRSAQQIESLLADAGFSEFQRIPTARPMLVSMLCARRS